MRKWIYRYLRADLAEIDMGPYATREEARSAMESHASFGATTTGPIEVANDYVLYKGEPGE